MIAVSSWAGYIHVSSKGRVGRAESDADRLQFFFKNHLIEVNRTFDYIIPYQNLLDFDAFLNVKFNLFIHCLKRVFTIVVIIVIIRRGRSLENYIDDGEVF